MCFDLIDKSDNLMSLVKALAVNGFDTVKHGTQTPLYRFF